MLSPSLRGPQQLGHERLVFDHDRLLTDENFDLTGRRVADVHEHRTLEGLQRRLILSWELCGPRAACNARQRCRSRVYHRERTRSTDGAFGQERTTSDVFHVPPLPPTIS